MEGITIIEENLCRLVEMNVLLGSGLFVTFMCIGANAIYWWAYKNTENKKHKKIIICCSIMAVIICIIVWIIQLHNYNKTHIEYVVEVDDSVRFNDFFDKYEIISSLIMKQIRKGVMTNNFLTENDLKIEIENDLLYCCELNLQ